MISDLREKYGIVVNPITIVKLNMLGAEPYCILGKTEKGKSFIVIASNDELSKFYLNRLRQLLISSTFSVPFFCFDEDENWPSLAIDLDLLHTTPFCPRLIELVTNCERTTQRILDDFLSIWPSVIQSSICKFKEYQLLKKYLLKEDNLYIGIESIYTCLRFKLDNKNNLINLPVSYRLYQPICQANDNGLRKRYKTIFKLKEKINKKALSLVKDSHRYEITLNEVKNHEMWNLVRPNYIFNRFDIRFGEQNMICLTKGAEKWNIPVLLKRKEVVLGISNLLFPSYVFDSICDYFFSCHYKVLRFDNAMFKVPRQKMKKQWILDLAFSSELMFNRMSKKSRYNLRRELRIAQEELGEMIFKNFLSDNCPDWIVELYFEFKRKTYSREYNLEPKKYLQKYMVTDIYILANADFMISKKVFAILFSCEQCDGIFLENLSYNPIYSNYSLGKQLYHQYIEEIVRKEKKFIFLGGGSLKYKMQYGSLGLLTCSGAVYSSFLVCFFLKIKALVKNRVERLLNTYCFQ